MRKTIGLMLLLAACTQVKTAGAYVALSPCICRVRHLVPDWRTAAAACAWAKADEEEAAAP